MKTCFTYSYSLRILQRIASLHSPRASLQLRSPHSQDNSSEEEYHILQANLLFFPPYPYRIILRSIQHFAETVKHCLTEGNGSFHGMTYWQDLVIHQLFSQGWELNTLSGPALEVCQLGVSR